ncbi:MAG: T9SS type A sorting domain-containing protein, partial [Bacteroidota bacterium]
IDNTFGTNGKTVTELGGYDWGWSSVIQSDGKIIVGGVCGVAPYRNFGLVRYNTNGTIDNTFGTGGKVITDFGGDDYGWSSGILSDGKIVLAGISNYNFALAKYNTDGTLDNTFGTGGKVITDMGSNDYGFCVSVQPNDRIIVAGQSDNSFALARYIGKNCSASSIEDYNSDQNDVSIYPNPANDYIIIAVPQKSNIEILNIQGQLLKSLVTTEDKTTIDISGLTSGMYFIKVTTEKAVPTGRQGIAVKKFIKE